MNERLQKEDLEKLPKEVQDNAYSTLKIYNSCNVLYYNGQYKVLTGCFILGSYPDDFKVIGEAYADDIYTKEERRQHLKELEKYATPY